MTTTDKNLISYSQVDRIVSWFSGLDHKKVEKISQGIAWPFIHEVYNSNMSPETMNKFRKQIEDHLKTI